MANPKALVVYFSGTGGTKYCASAITDALKDKGCEVNMHSLDAADYETVKADHPGLIVNAHYLFILYAVHAMDAPMPVYDWIEDLPHGQGIKTIVISVSGGGEMWPNTSCRVYCIKTLEKKGYDVVYEKMLVMPANVLVGENDDLCMHMLNALPIKSRRIVEDVLAGKRLRTRFKISTRWMHFISNTEHRNARRFGQLLYADPNCSGCGACARNCPRQNITMEGGRPQFHDRCIICMRCIYQCPKNAIAPSRLKFFVVKKGFDLAALEKRMKGVPLKPVKECCKGVIWVAVRKYLLEKEA